MKVSIYEAIIMCNFISTDIKMNIPNHAQFIEHDAGTWDR